MQPLILSQIALYQLQQLAKAVRDKTGNRYRLSNTKSTISLLVHSSTSPDADIFKYFGRFTNELDENQLDYLKDNGVILHQALLNKIQTMTEHHNVQSMAEHQTAI